MDQGPLVSEQIDAGSKLAKEFDKNYKPLQAAFWLKECEVGQWYFYLASEQIDDTNFADAYGEVIRLVGKGPHIWLDPFQVKVTGLDAPVAKEVNAIQQKYPDMLPMRLRDCMLGGVFMDEVYIYSVPVHVPTPLN